MKRVDGWDVRLVAAIEEARRKPFAWGTHDCVIGTCDIVLATTGVDMAEGLRGTYDDLQSAAAAMKRICGGGVEQLAEYFAARHGCLEVHANFCQRGGVTLSDAGEWGPALGICIGRATANVGRAGMDFLSMRAVRRAWIV